MSSSVQLTDSPNVQILLGTDPRKVPSLQNLLAPPPDLVTDEDSKMATPPISTAQLAATPSESQLAHANLSSTEYAQLLYANLDAACGGPVSQRSPQTTQSDNPSQIDNAYLMPNLPDPTFSPSIIDEYHASLKNLLDPDDSGRFPGIEAVWRPFTPTDSSFPLVQTELSRARIAQAITVLGRHSLSTADFVDVSAATLSLYNLVLYSFHLNAYDDATTDVLDGVVGFLTFLLDHRSDRTTSVTSRTRLAKPARCSDSEVQDLLTPDLTELDTSTVCSVVFYTAVHQYNHPDADVALPPHLDAIADDLHIYASHLATIYRHHPTIIASGREFRTLFHQIADTAVRDYVAHPPNPDPFRPSSPDSPMHTGPDALDRGVAASRHAPGAHRTPSPPPPLSLPTNPLHSSLPPRVNPPAKAGSAQTLPIKPSTSVPAVTSTAKGPK
ncbi:hypothetical protein L227DRAFT_612006, partial [Lentinus tigrinus ALCF2SS1-6]